MIKTKGTELARLEAEVFSLPEKMKGIEVKDKPSLEHAHKALIYSKGVRKKINDFCDPNINRLHVAHKEALAQKKKFEEPFIEFENYINPQIASYLVKLEQIRREAEEKARREKEEAERKVKEEEETRLAKAIEEEEKGNIEEAEKILDREPPVQDPLTQKTIVPFKTKLKGLSTRTDWLWELIDFEKVPDEWKKLVLDEAKINAAVKAAKEKAKIEGIRIYSKTITIQRGGC